MTPARSERPVVLARTVRTISFFAALAASLALMLFPFLLRSVPQDRPHAALPIMLLGLAGAFVYGIGYSPDNALLRILFSPICAWLLVSGGALLLFAH